ncbi:hypothetical protein WAX74_09125 [Psychrobacillus sp. FJAT-51614]|uniref:DUF4139 domain-containing protein n=1 Tax=Psychrobacillus mangrovi TaxID=3117745 RepID=A0ABU8F479_9BACI
MCKPNEIGKRHVLDVYNALKHYLYSNSIVSYSEPVQETVKYIVGLYPDIRSVRNKFETDKPDSNPDLLLTLHNNDEAKLNLFYIKRRAAIQPKNLGAKSFLENYFLSQELQDKFNAYFSKEYELYLQSIMDFRGYRNVYDRIPELKKKVRAYYPKFEAEINPFRRSFLFILREYCFQLMKDEFNKETTGIEHAFKELMMFDTTNIITRYTKENKCFGVEEWKSIIKIEQEIQIYKKGNDTIGIRSGTEALTIRFKFESGPTSSVKLATSYEHFPEEEGVVHKNLRSIQIFEGLLEQHKQINKKDDSNAVGKCNEAMVYYRILETDPKIHQVDEEDFHLLLKSYAPYISHKTLLNIQQSSTKAVEKIDEYLNEKYPVYKIESIQLVPENYIKDRLDTSDLKIIIRVEGEYIEESLSLKAISKSSAKITVKNPGAGTILGPLYFDIGSLTLVTDEVRDRFNQKLITRYQCLELISAALGESLRMADQKKLQKGVAAIRGTATTIITNYTKDKSLILKHDVISGEVEVFPRIPSPIQTTLRWNDKQEELSLRIKFGKGKQHGWSSVKLACEYSVEV